MRIALLDWNGTLFDDIPVWYESVKEIFRVFGKQPPTIAEYFRELEGDYLEIYQSRGITASRDELNAIYEPFYNARIHEAVLFPGVENALRALASRGMTMGILTAQKDFLVSPFLAKFGLGTLFRYNEFHVLDKKVIIQQILERESVDQRECCFVGDVPSDIRHGKKAGVITIAFLNGYIPEDLLAKAGPELTIRNFEDITRVI